MGTRAINMNLIFTRSKLCGMSKFGDFYGNKKKSKILSTLTLLQEQKL